MGDINIDFSDTNSGMFKKYLNILNGFHLKQLITEATRISGTTRSLLDHVLTNSKGKISHSGVLCNSFSDHLPIFLLRLNNKNPSGLCSPIIKKIRSLKSYSPQYLCTELRKCDWKPVLLAINVDEALANFVSIFHGVLDKVAPIKDVRVRKNSEPWMTSDILACIKKRNKLFTLFKKDKSRTDVYHEYCKLRNRIQRDIKLAKQFHF